jgi:hypothetical protein
VAKLIYTRLEDHPRETYVITSGALIVGRVDCISDEPAPAAQWTWGLHLDIGAAPFRRGATVSSRDDAVAALERAWAEWKLWAGLRDADPRETPETATVAPPRKALR